MELDYKKEMETNFKTRENAKPSMPEIYTGESKTIPDASISMRQILDRFQRGIPVTRSLRQPVYNENFDYPDNMQFDDIHNAKLQMREEVKLKKSEYARQEKEREKKTIDGSQEKSSEPSA